MYYFLNLFKRNIKDIFNGQLKGHGITINLDDNSDIFNYCNIADQKSLQSYADKKMSEAKTNWAVSNFGEKREKMFRLLDVREMVRENRFFHLGVDIWCPKGTLLYSPFSCEVVESSYEEKYGSYGGYIVVKYEKNGKYVYVLFGHLNPNTLPSVGTIIKSGDILGEIGSMKENGGYFYHTHIQIITDEGVKKGFIHKGYTNKEMFLLIDKYILDPAFLFKD